MSSSVVLDPELSKYRLKIDAKKQKPWVISKRNIDRNAIIKTRNEPGKRILSRNSRYQSVDQGNEKKNYCTI